MKQSNPPFPDGEIVHKRWKLKINFFSSCWRLWVSCSILIAFFYLNKHPRKRVQKSNVSCKDMSHSSNSALFNSTPAELSLLNSSLVWKFLPCDGTLVNLVRNSDVLWTRAWLGTIKNADFRSINYGIKAIAQAVGWFGDASSGWCTLVAEHIQPVCHCTERCGALPLKKQVRFQCFVKQTWCYHIYKYMLETWNVTVRHYMGKDQDQHQKGSGRKKCSQPCNSVRRFAVAQKEIHRRAKSFHPVQLSLVT